MPGYGGADVGRNAAGSDCGDQRFLPMAAPLDAPDAAGQQRAERDAVWRPNAFAALHAERLRTHGILPLAGRFRIAHHHCDWTDFLAGPQTADGPVVRHAAGDLTRTAVRLSDRLCTAGAARA